jgi:ABC-type polysaccharide/polyol phosphate transport system ATPase subunit
MGTRQLSDQDVYQDGRVRFVGARIRYGNGVLEVSPRNDDNNYELGLTLNDVKLDRTIGNVHTFVGNDEAGTRTVLKVLPNAKKGGCGCAKARRGT